MMFGVLRPDPDVLQAFVDPLKHGKFGANSKP